ncbi:coiled-coil domain-containing protein 57 isoform X2 [Brachyistius frenatus]
MKSDGGLRDMEARLDRKEKEWKELQEQRVDLLQTSLRTVQEERRVLREHYQQLRDDFHFNLAVLEERDRELQRYDVVTAHALSAEHDRQAELNRLRVQITRLEEQRVREAEERQEEQRVREAEERQEEQRVREAEERQEEQRVREAEERQEEQRTRQHTAEQQLRSSTAGKMDEYEQMKVDLQRRIKDVEGELEQQKLEMSAAFDGELRRREHDFNVKMEEMRAALLSRDIQVKLLSEETEVQSQAQLQTSEALKASMEVCEQVQRQLEIRDVRDTKDLRIKELEDELRQMETKLKEQREEHVKKYQEVVRAGRRLEAQLEAQHQNHTEQLHKAQNQKVQLREKMEAQAAETRCIQEEVLQKEETIRRLRSEVEATRADWEEIMKQVSMETVLKDTEMIRLQQTGDRLRTEIERSREQLESYKQQLSAGLRRERLSEQKAVQVELDCQRRCEDMKAELYLSNEQLIQDLSRARDQAEADLKEKEEEVQDFTVFLRSVHQGVPPDVDSLSSEEIHRLQQQNSVLRAVVTQMRKDMEGLSCLRPQVDPQTSSPPSAQHPASSVRPSANTQVAPRPPADIFSKTDCTQPVDQEVSCSRHLEGQLGGATGVSHLAAATDRPAEELTCTVSHHKHRENQGGLRPGDPADTPAPATILDQSALVRRLQEEKLYLQQQVSAPTSAAVFGDVRRGKSSPPLLRSRLKQAASCIARLSREKQQLIEMGNRLRAQITTGLQESVEPERDTTETAGDPAGDPADRLSVLQQLQYQLTSQELQYALKQRTRLLPGTNSRAPPTEGPADSQGNDVTERSKSSEYKETRPPPSQLHSGVSRPHLSSDESLRSLKELWDKLDHGLGLSVFSEGEGELSRKDLSQSAGSGVQITVHGPGLVHSQPSAEVQQKRDPAKTPSNRTRTSRPAAPGRTSRIRNYNIKD